MTHYNDYREHLKTITLGLREMAKAAGRDEVEDNQLLRECYNLVGIEMDTMEGWKAKGHTIRKGQHAYLFWCNDDDFENEDGFGEVAFMYAEEQTSFTGEKKDTIWVVQTIQLCGDEGDGADIMGDTFYRTRAAAIKAAKERFNDEINNEDAWTHDIYDNWRKGDPTYHMDIDDNMGCYIFEDFDGGRRFEINVVTLEGKL